jgi:hypothetical protein
VNRLIQRSTLALLTLTFSGPLGIAQSQHQPAINSPLIVKTIVPHINSIAQPGQASVAPVPGQEALPPAFTQPPYIVGPVVVPTTTAPEAEEHVTADPNNFLNLLAMISDFCLNGGFNTSKWAFSKRRYHLEAKLRTTAGWIPGDGRRSRVAGQQRSGGCDR